MEASGKIEVYTKKEQANLRKEKAKLGIKFRWYQRNEETSRCYCC